MRVQSYTKVTISVLLLLLCFSFISSVYAPTETRYFRSDLDDSYYKLLTSNTASTRTLSKAAAGELSGYIAVRICDQDGNVIVDWSEAECYFNVYTLISINVNVPSTSVNRIIVDVRVRVDGNSNTRSFRTEVFNGVVSGTWNFKLWGEKTYSSKLDITTVYFAHGSATYDSRIENFTWTEAPVGEWHDVATWTFNLLTRQAQTVAQWSFNLQTMRWNSITTLTFSLLARQWQEISSWLFNLATFGWHTIAYWLFDLPSRIWTAIASWNFDLLTRTWQNIATFTFSLLTRLWQTIATISFSLIARIWQNIMSWSFSLATMAWNTIVTWAFNFLVMGWNNIVEWLFNLPIISWKTIATWLFNLSGLGWHFITQLTFYLTAEILDYIALGLSGIGLILCLFSLFEKDNEAFSILAFVFCLSGLAFALLGFSYALSIAVLGFVFSVVALALAVTKKG